MVFIQGISASSPHWVNADPDPASYLMQGLFTTLKDVKKISFQDIIHNFFIFVDHIRMRIQNTLSGSWDIFQLGQCVADLDKLEMRT